MKKEEKVSLVVASVVTAGSIATLAHIVLVGIPTLPPEKVEVLQAIWPAFPLSIVFVWIGYFMCRDLLSWEKWKREESDKTGARGPEE